MPRITPNLWFDTESKEAAEFYVSVFPNSEIKQISYYGEAGPRPAGDEPDQPAAPAQAAPARPAAPAQQAPAQAPAQTNLGGGHASSGGT